MATNLATAARRDINPYDQLRGQLSNRVDDFKAGLPGHITPDKFQRTVLTAVQQNAMLLNCDRGSLITACMKAAQDGLLPDGREAALVPFKTRKKGDGGQWFDAWLVQYMPMVYGLRKKILQSDEISTLDTNVVYRAEVESGAFLYEAGTEAMLRHRPMLDLTAEQATDDQIVAAYSVAKMKDGSQSFEVMRRAEIDKVRETSQTGATRDRQGKARNPSGPWVDWFGEMARKTVMRRHSKTLPMSGDIIDVEAADEAIAARSASRLLDAVEPDAPKLAAPTRADVAAEQNAAAPEATGEAEDTAEEVARRLDAQQAAAERGLDDDGGEEPEGGEPNGGTLAPDNPASEGPADEDRGDQHDGTDDALDDDTRSASERIADGLVDELLAANDLKAVKATEERFVQQRAVLDDADRQRVESELRAARTRLRPAADR